MREAAAQPGGETEGKPPKLPFNLDRLSIPDEEKAAFSRTVTALKKPLKEVQGKVTLDEMKTGATRLLGITTDAQLERAARDGMLGTAEGHVAVRTRLQELQKEFTADQAEATRLKPAGGENYRVAEDKALASSLKLGNFILAAKGAQSEAARALASYRVLVEPRSEAEVLLSRLFKEKGGLKPEEAARIIKTAAEAPERLADEVQKVFGHRLTNMALEIWKAGLLSGPPTHAANAIGNLVKQGVTLAETAFTAHVTEPILAKRMGRERERFAGEAGASFAAMRSVAPQAFRKLWQDTKDAFTLKPDNIDTEGGGRLEYQAGAVPGKIGRAVRIPFRMLEEAVDRYFKTLAGEQALYKTALRRYKGDSDLAQRFLEKYHSLTPEARKVTFPEVVKAVEDARLSETFQGKLDETKLIEAGAQTLITLGRKFPALDLIFPFKKTPAKIATATLERTPVGIKYAIDAYKAYKAGKLSAGEVSDAVTKPILGTAFMMAFGAAARAGLMTGSGPTDPKKRQLLEATGWRPYSFVLPGADGPQYLAFNRFEPVSSLLGMAADIVETGDEKKAGDILQKVGGTILENMTNKTFLAGLEGAATAIADPKQYAGQFVKQLSGTVVPNILAKAAQAYDPISRSTAAPEGGFAGLPESIRRTIVSRIPVASESLPARRTATGEEVRRPGSAIERFLSPAARSETIPGTDLEKFLVDIDAVPSQPSRDFTIPGSKGKTLRLNDQEYSVLQEANRQASDEIRRRYLSNGTFKRMDPEAQKRLIEQVFTRARGVARDRLRARRDFRVRMREALAS